MEVWSVLFESTRIRLRKMIAEDIPVYHRWRNDLSVMSSTSPILDVYSLSETEEFCRSVLGAPGSKSYVIVEKSRDQPIGITSLVRIDTANRNAECIIDIGEKEYWGQGYGAEALRLLLRYAFLELGLHRVCLRVFSFNTRAIRLYKKLGFQEEGRLRESLFRSGQWHDTLIMAILEHEFRQDDTY
jgi:diamine N-acetyltransferase